ncbi:MAG: asparagine synthase (glutamine-hydrolyzing) [Gammaproteobacteria bacterium]
MCGIAGVVSLSGARIPDLERRLRAMSSLISHRGPDGDGFWMHSTGRAGFAHRRLSIIDLSVAAAQPMRDPAGNVITYNGEVYNYLELRRDLDESGFRTNSDTEVVLSAFGRWGADAVSRLRGMFAYAIWDERTGELHLARDRFGIKPLYYAVVGDLLHFASEPKALLPFLPDVQTDLGGFKDYLAFQFCLAGKTLFKGVQELLPGHVLQTRGTRVQVRRYWEVYYHLDHEHTARYFEDRLRALMLDSVRVHLRSDVPLGAYVSGGFDSSLVAALARREIGHDLVGFTGKFTLGPEYDESRYARAVAEWSGFPLHEIDIQASDFIDNIRRVIYHLDYPAAGPGSFSQFMVSGLAAQHRKVVLGGQGGDESFGGYTRYLIAYFEQCIKGAIDGTLHGGDFIVTYESIIPNLTALGPYKPLLKEFWREGLFDEMDKRYYRLINRAPLLGDEIRWDQLGEYSPYEEFREIFYSDNVGKQSYFDLMTHFDFKTLLPALLQVEDRVSMAHGLESRVPFLDHPLVEFAATIPSNVKFEHGSMKHVLKCAMRRYLPDVIADRTDKMGFPTPLNEWIKGPAREFVGDVFGSRVARERDLIDNDKVLRKLGSEPKFGRNVWGLLCLELWQQEFHDRAAQFRAMPESVDAQG